MKKFVLTFIISLIGFNLDAQITFQKTYNAPISNAQGYCISQTNDGGYITTGYTTQQGTGKDVCLIRTDSNGDTLWTKSFGGGIDETGYCIKQTLDGGYIISGVTTSFGAGHQDVYLIKIDSIGNTMWIKAIGNTNGDYVEEGYSVQQTTDSGYIILGYTMDIMVGNLEILLIKTDANGNLLWSKAFGGVGKQRGMSIQQTTDDGFIIAGVTYSLASGSFDVYLIKTDSNGDSLWTRAYGGIYDDGATFIRQTPDGGYIITGHTDSYGAGDQDVYLLKTDSIGNLLWSKTFGGTGYEYGYAVKRSNDGGYIITGCITSYGSGGFDVYLIKTDSSGNSLWSKTFGGIGYDVGNSVLQTADGGYIIAGMADIFATGYSASYLIKTDANGNSGCNQVNPPTIETAPSTQVFGTATTINFPSTIATSAAPVIGSSTGIVTTLCASVGINYITLDDSFLIFPNPSAGNFIISFEGTIMKGKVEMLNILGEKVFAANIFHESKKEMNLKNISSGVYFVKVFDGEKYFSNKIIIQQN